MRILSLCSLVLWATSGLPGAALHALEKVVSITDIALVWSGHPVGFSLLTLGTDQVVAFYDTNRNLTVASRKVNQAGWHFKILPSQVGWDSHNYITMAADRNNQLHLSGNMHVNPLVYFRTRVPMDIDTFEKIPTMLGDREKRCTYPRFLEGPQKQMIFTYRDGRSGSGDQLFNIFDPVARQWTRLLDQPLFSGEGKMNAYYSGPTLGPDGYYHVCWVWRDHGGCESNHDLGYVRSKDLIHWEKSNGQPVALPITLATAEIVAPVPTNGGIINGNNVVGFDRQKRVIVSYHKYDSKGMVQIYNARLENGKWIHYQATDWDYRWEFKGGGSIPFEIHIGNVEVDDQGRLVQSWSHPKSASGLFQLDEKTLKPIGKITIPSPYKGWEKQLTVPAGLKANSARDLGRSSEPGVKYQLRWNTLPPNRDRPQTVPLPAPSMLRMIKLVGQK
jgi:hypothetical protein